MEVRCGDQGLGVVGDGGWLTGSDKGAEEGGGGGGGNPVQNLPDLRLWHCR